MNDKDLPHILISQAESAAVHYQMFSWRTACGKQLNPGEAEVVNGPVTCKVCKASRILDYDGIFETNLLGVTYVRDRSGIGYMYDDMKFPLYTIDVHSPFSGVDKVHLSANLPEEYMAISLGEMVAMWLFHAAQGKYFGIEFESSGDQGKSE